MRSLALDHVAVGDADAEKVALLQGRGQVAGVVDTSLRRHSLAHSIGNCCSPQSLIRVGCLIAALIVSALLAASAQAAVTDPRKCSTNTPGGEAHHAYWCAHNAAVATVRTVLARRQNAGRWYAPVFCDQAGPLLRWNCQSFLGGDKWLVTVTWKATSSGWHRYASVVQTKR